MVRFGYETIIYKIENEYSNSKIDIILRDYFSDGIINKKK